MKNGLVKITCLILATISVVTVVISGSSAAITESSEVPFDQKLSDQGQNNYSPIEQIAVIRITSPAGVQFGDSSDWMKGLYYYSITKLGFADIPYNYVVTWDGKSFEGKGGGYESLPIVSWAQSGGVQNAVLVAYFDNGRELTNAGKQSLVDTLADIVEIYSLERSDIVAAEVSYERKTGGAELSSLLLNRVDSSAWAVEVRDLASKVRVGRLDRKYEASVESVESPEKVGAGENFVVKATIKNEGRFPWYSEGKRIMFLATSDPRGKESKFFVTDKWASFSRVVPQNEEWVLPGEDATFDFEINTPLIPGNYSESFELLELPGSWVSGSSFKIDFEVEKGDLDLVEILDTETGYLNVRDCPSTGCKELGKVSTGDILIKTGKDGSWYKVRWGDDKEGWVYGKYVKEL